MLINGILCNFRTPDRGGRVRHRWVNNSIDPRNTETSPFSVAFIRGLNRVCE